MNIKKILFFCIFVLGLSHIKSMEPRFLLYREIKNCVIDLPSVSFVDPVVIDGDVLIRGSGRTVSFKKCFIKRGARLTIGPGAFFEICSENGDTRALEFEDASSTLFFDNSVFKVTNKGGYLKLTSGRILFNGNCQIDVDTPILFHFFGYVIDLCRFFDGLFLNNSFLPESVRLRDCLSIDFYDGYSGGCDIVTLQNSKVRVVRGRLNVT